MLFSSTIFLFLFLPIVILLYYFAKREYRNAVLLIASIWFYAYGEPRMVWLLLISVLFNYAVSIGMEKTEDNHILKKCMLIVAISVNVGVLFVCKYLNFTIEIVDYILGDILQSVPMVLPLGISFYTFQLISYLVDVYRKEIKVPGNIINFALYVTFFPQLVTGPIVRYKTMARDLEERKESFEDVCQGVRRFLIGFIKKVVLANNLSLIVEYAFGMDNYDNLPLVTAWVGAISFTLQIYFDFAGYSDMALGLGRVFGFHFEENFNYPYAAKNFTDFWRRWHISLSTWFRDYIYIPLGGSRVSSARNIFNLLVVWTVTGIWHGAAWNFVAWGILYFVCLVVEKKLIHPEKFRSKIVETSYRIITLLGVNFLWVFFNAKAEYGMSAVRRGAGYCLSMIGLNNNPIFSKEILFYLQQYGWFLIVGVLAATPLAMKLKEVFAKNKGTKLLWEVIACTTLVVCFFYSVANLVMGSHNPFIYFNF